MRRFAPRPSWRAVAFAAPLALCTGAACAQSPDHVAQPDFAPDGSLAWIAQGSEFLAPKSGIGPVLQDPAHPRVSNAESRATGRPVVVQMGDPNSPILQPWAANAVLTRNQSILSGKSPGLTIHVTCWPMGVPGFHLLAVNPMYIVQSPKEVLLIASEDQEVRHIYLGVPHSAHVAPSWYGESVGHYEADTLVVDTIGLNDQTFVDNFRTPHTAKLHVVERFHLVDAGKTLQVDIHVEDPGAFTTPWNAVQRYRRTLQGPLREQRCAENQTNYFHLNLPPIPVAARADF
jgi:hypothetical protein